MTAASSTDSGGEQHGQWRVQGEQQERRGEQQAQRDAEPVLPLPGDEAADGDAPGRRVDRAAREQQAAASFGA